MKVTFLGVGSAFSKKNANSNVLIESGAIKLLIDCGRSAPSSLIDCGLSIKNVTHLLVTHLHSDHIGGLEEVAFLTRLVFRFKIKLIGTASMLSRLWEASLRGGLEFIEETPEDLTPQKLSDFFIPMEHPILQWQALEAHESLQVYFHPTNHVRGMESYAVEMQEAPGSREKRFLFTGDTKFDPALIQHGVNHCAYVFHDCQLLDSGEKNVLGVHTSYNQLQQLPAEIRRQLWLYHYGDEPQPNAGQDGFAGFLQHLQSFTL